MLQLKEPRKFNARNFETTVTKDNDDSTSIKSIDGINPPAKKQRPSSTGRRPIVSKANLNVRHANNDELVDELINTPIDTEDNLVAANNANEDISAKDIEESLEALDIENDQPLPVVSHEDDDEHSSRYKIGGNIVGYDAEDGKNVDKSNSDQPLTKQLHKKHKKWSLKKKILLTILIVVILAVIAISIYVYTMLDKVSTIFEGNVTDILTPVELKKDAEGRSNILVFGTSEDDAGHSGALLADSILVLSVDQNSGDVAMFSIPRDLWVTYQAPCSVGYSGKINAAYYCGLETNGNNEVAAAESFATTVGQTVGMEIPYYIKVNYGAISGITDALGGIDVEIYSDDPRGIYDVQTGLNLPAGVNHLDGQTALMLARARNSKGGYGLSRSNFDREKNQQRIIQALQKKALSIGVLANPQQALDILNSLGDNIKTNVTMSELRKALDVALAMGDNGIRSIDISDLLTTGRVGNASTVLPIAGQGNFTDLQNYLKQQIYIDTTADNEAANGMVSQ